MDQNRQAHEGAGETIGRFAKTFPNTLMLHRPFWSKTDLGSGSVPRTACRWIPWPRCLEVLPSLSLGGNPIGCDYYPNSSFRLAQPCGAHLATWLRGNPDHQ